VGDLGLLITGRKRAQIIEHLVHYNDVATRISAAADDVRTELAHHLRSPVCAPQQIACRANWLDPYQGAGNRAIKNERIGVNTGNPTTGA
jgi:hypothetical protein